MAKFRSAFTLIELMVVVAIIAILSTMGVANFSTAIKRSRNAVRQNDVIAVSKGLETCYDVMGALYLKDDTGKSCTGTGSVVGYSSKFGGSAEGVFAADLSGKESCKNHCINSDIVPTIRNYDYDAAVGEVSGVQKYIICAKLERVGNVESIGNSKENLAQKAKDSGDMDNSIKSIGASTNKCTAASTAGGTDDCYFCIAAQQ